MRFAAVWEVGVAAGLFSLSNVAQGFLAFALFRWQHIQASFLLLHECFELKAMPCIFVCCSMWKLALIKLQANISHALLFGCTTIRMVWDLFPVHFRLIFATANRRLAQTPFYRRHSLNWDNRTYRDGWLYHRPALILQMTREMWKIRRFS